MPPVVTSAEIGRPAAEVFAYATGPARFSEWQKGVVDGHMDSPDGGTGTPAVGARCVTARRIGGASRRIYGVRLLSEPVSRYDVTVTVDRDGGYLPDPAEFAVAVGQAASIRNASVVSARTWAGHQRGHGARGRSARGRGCRPGRGIRNAKASGGYGQFCLGRA
jgi:hypothetical protein